jgi:hypothetical protein
MSTLLFFYKWHDLYEMITRAYSIINNCPGFIAIKNNTCLDRWNNTYRSPISPNQNLVILTGTVCALRSGHNDVIDTLSYMVLYVRSALRQSCRTTENSWRRDDRSALFRRWCSCKGADNMRGSSGLLVAGPSCHLENVARGSMLYNDRSVHVTNVLVRPKDWRSVPCLKINKKK